MRCADCGYHLTEPADYCPRCGSWLLRQPGSKPAVTVIGCPDCGHVLSDEGTCGRCGWTFQNHQPGGCWAPARGTLPITISDTASNQRRRLLAEAALRARGMTPSASDPAEGKLRKRRRMRWATTLGLVAALMVTGIVLVPRWFKPASGVVTSSSGQPTVTSRPPAKSTAPALPAGQILPPSATADGAGILVNPKVGANVPLVEEYLDYQCPACRHADRVFGARLAELARKGVIRLEFHAMTFLDTNLRNDSSTRAAIAAACADTVGAYSAYHRVIFANQPDHEGTGYLDSQLRSDFPALAHITVRQLRTFQKCYDSRATATFVAGINRAANAAGVRRTPTLRFNGKDVGDRLDVNDASSLDRVLGTAGR